MARFHLDEKLRGVKFIVTEKGMVVARSWGRGKWEFLEDRVPVREDEKLVELDEADGCRQCECA